MDKIDLTGQPSWLIAISMLGVGVFLPLALALIGKNTGKKEQDERPERVIPMEMTSPWLVQNLLEIKMTAEAIKLAVDNIAVTIQQRTR